MTERQAAPEGKYGLSLRDAGWGFAQYTGMSAIVLAQPILVKIAESPDLLAKAGARGPALVLLALFLIVAPAVLMLGVESAVALARPGWRIRVRAGFLGLLAAVFVWQVGTRQHVRSPGVELIALAALPAVALAYLRWDATRTLFRTLGIAGPVVFAYILLSPAGQVIGADDEVAERSELKAPVVVIVFDEFPLAALLGPGEDIDEKRFPSFGRLRETATWYRGARAVSDQTVEAVPPILTGNVAGGAFPTLAEYPDNLIALLGAAPGSVISESATDLCPRDICEPRSDLSSQLVSLVDSVDEAAVTLPWGLTEDVVEGLQGPGIQVPSQDEQIDEFTSALDSPGRSLYFLHVELPHSPYRFLPGGWEHGYYPSPGEDFGVWTGPPRTVEQAFQRYLLQVEATDQMLGRIFDQLDAAGVYEESLVVVTADHGLAFEPGYYRRRFSVQNAGWILPVPLFVKAPGQRAGAVSDRPAETIDLLPTIADHLGEEIPWEMEGESLLSPSAPETIQTVHPKGEEPFEIPTAVVDAALRDAVAWRNRIIPRGSLYAWAGHSRWLGRAPESVLLVAVPEAELAEKSLFTNVDVADGRVPALVTGSIPGFVGSPGATLALVVNGEVAATGYPVAERGVTIFRFVAQPTAFRDGENEVEVYLHRPPGERGEPSATLPPTAPGDED